MSKMGHLRVNTHRLGDIRDVVNFLRVFENVYNHLYAFDLIVESVKDSFNKINIDFPSSSERKKPVKTLISITRPEDIILFEDRLRIKKIVIESPGVWEFMGNSSPFETLRKYLNDRHERKKDIKYRNRQAEAKGEEELEQRRLENIKDKIQILKDCGVPEEKIRKAVIDYIDKPLKVLDEEQDKGFAEDAKLLSDSKDPDSDNKQKDF